MEEGVLRQDSAVSSRWSLAALTQHESDENTRWRYRLEERGTAPLRRVTRRIAAGHRDVAYDAKRIVTTAQSLFLQATPDDTPPRGVDLAKTGSGVSQHGR
jgi:hypothetical protein